MGWITKLLGIDKAVMKELEDFQNSPMAEQLTKAEDGMRQAVIDSAATRKKLDEDPEFQEMLRKGREDRKKNPQDYI